MGLGTCWVGAFSEEEAKEVLKVPDGVRLVAIVPVGYAVEAVPPRRRRPVEHVTDYERF